MAAEGCDYDFTDVVLYVAKKAADAERERICAAIEAEDDYCVDEGDYMLDSDDCIKVARGEWERPDYSVDARGTGGEGWPANAPANGVTNEHPSANKTNPSPANERGDFLESSKCTCFSPATR
jgi:hypothetical protein